MTDTAPQSLSYLIDDDALTKEECAEDLGVALATLASWRATDRGPPYWKWGRTIVYSRRANMEWKQAQRVNPQAP
jgi:hypothetical protein